MPSSSRDRGNGVTSHRKKPLPAGWSGRRSFTSSAKKRVRPLPVEPPESPRHEERPGEDRHAEERDQHPDSEREAGDDHREPDDSEDEAGAAGRCREVRAPRSSCLAL